VTDREWAEGLADLLKAGLPGWPTDPDEARMRAEFYRRRLDGLSGAAWRHAVDLAVDREKFFPPVSSLLEYASEYRPPALPPARRTDEEKAEARESAKRGLELIKAELAKRGFDIGEPVKDMPDAR
jgi:hypothetical protein